MQNKDFHNGFHYDFRPFSVFTKKILIKKYQLKPQETLFIGDMIHDIEAAQYSGVHSCAVLTGYTQRIDLELARPELIIHDLSVLHMAMKYSLEWDAILNRIKKNQ